ncbi:MAG: hypothetical protein WCP85_05505 [Mariniphaga sp.]
MKRPTLILLLIRFTHNFAFAKKGINSLIAYFIDCFPGGTISLSMFMAGSSNRLATTFMEPTDSTTEVTAIGQSTATRKENFTSDGGPTVTAYGVCGGTSANPKIDYAKTAKLTDLFLCQLQFLMQEHITGITMIPQFTKLLIRLYTIGMQLKTYIIFYQKEGMFQRMLSGQP